MENGGLAEAWAIWASGGQIAQYELWGMKVLWWGRLGKFLQLLSALFVIIEIIGSTRLFEIATQCFTVAHRARHIDNKIALFLRAHLNWTRFFTIFFMGGLLLGVEEQVKESMPLVRSVISIILFVAYIPLIALIIVSLYLALIIIAGHIIRILACWLSKPTLNNIAKLIALVIFLIGFHFDFLSA